MKYISLAIIFALFFLLAIDGGNAKIIPVRRSQRTLTPEDVAFTLIYLGTCSKFYSIPSIIISKKTADNCLPISSTPPYSLNDELSAHILCTDIGPNRAQIDFVEIFDPADPNMAPVPDFIISFTTNAPYKATATGVSYFRLPSCEIDEDYCSTTDYVKSCTENLVQLSNGFVVSKDLVIIVPGGNQYVGCSFAENTCCAYVVPGFCPRGTNDAVFLVKYKSQEKPHHGKPHHERPHHEKPHHERPHDDDDKKEEHNEDANKKQEPQQENKTQEKQEDKSSKNNAPNRGKHPINNHQEEKKSQQKQEKTLPLLPLNPPQNNQDQEEEQSFVVFNLKKKINTDSKVAPASKKAQPSKKIADSKKKVEVLKPLIPLREVHVAKHQAEEDDDEYKRK